MKQKKLLTAMLLTLGLLLTSSARSQVGWQVRGGVGWSRLSGLSLMENRLSFRLGVASVIPVYKQFALEPGLFFVQKGSDFSGSYGGEQMVPVNLDNRLNYLEIPVLAAYRIALGKAGELTVKAGPYAAIGLTGRAHVSSDDLDFHRTFPGDLFGDGCTYDGATALRSKAGYSYMAGSAPYDRFDAGLILGLDYRYRHFILGAEASWGMVPVSRRLFDVEVPYVMKLRNSAAHLSVGYQF